MLVATPEEISLNDVMLARTAAEDLHATYPGHLWGVTVLDDGAILDIRNLALSGIWGFRIKLADFIHSSSALKAQVLRGGGELLERYRVSRSKHGVDDVPTLVRDYRGNFVADQ